MLLAGVASFNGLLYVCGGSLNTGRLVLKKNLFFCVGEYAEYRFDQQRLIWYVCRLWDMVFS